MGRYHNFNLQFGYVKDSRPATMLCGHDQGFDDVESAMEDLRKTLYGYLWLERGLNFCPVCGTPVKAMKKVSGYDVAKAFEDLFMSTMDDLGDIYGYLENHGWTIGATIGEQRSVEVQAVGRWMAREDEEDRPWMEADYPDGGYWNSRDGLTEPYEKRKRIYIGHPLVGDGSPEWGNMEKNVERYLRFVAMALNEGHTVLSWVHNYLTHIRGLTQGDGHFYLAGDLDELKLADEFWLAGPPKVSSGLAQEFDAAQEFLIPIRHEPEWDDPEYLGG